MIASPFTSSPILQALLLAIVSLAVVSVAGLVYPIVKGRAVIEEARTLEKGYTYYYGTKETLAKLKKMKESGNYSEGVVLAYRALRNLLPKVDLLSRDNRNTEFEIISEMIRTSPELHNIAQSIMHAYEYYERARFSNPISVEEFDTAIATFDRIYSGPGVRQKSRGS